MKEKQTQEQHRPKRYGMAIDLDKFLGGCRDFEMLFEPEERTSLGGVASTVNHLLITTLDNVRGRLYRLTPGDDGWTKEEIELLARAIELSSKLRLVESV